MRSSVALQTHRDVIRQIALSHCVLTFKEHYHAD